MKIYAIINKETHTTEFKGSYKDARHTLTTLNGCYEIVECYDNNASGYRLVSIARVSDGKIMIEKFVG